MKLTTTILALLAQAQISCTVIHGDAGKGTYTYASLGGNAKDYAQTSGGVTASSIDNSTSFQEGTKTIRNIVYAQVLGSVTKAGLTAWQNTKNATTAAGVQNAKTAAGVEEARISAETTKALAAPAQ